MPFVTTELAGSIERAECDLLEAAASAVARVRPDTDVVIRPLAGGLAVHAGDGSPLNKVAGLGFDGPLDMEELAAVEHLWAERDTPVQVELSVLADPSIGAELTGRGYRLVGFENVLGCDLTLQRTAADPPPGVTIDVSGPEALDAWLDTVVTGFAHPDTQGVPSHESFPREVLERVIGDMTGAEGFVRYLARREGEPAGAGSMRLGDTVAHLSGASTLPEHRRRGIQTALLARRLSDAAEAGCTLAVVTTQPGSKSQENVERKGFRLLYARAVLVRE